MNEVKELVEELRNKKSRDNRELLDRSADMIERLAKELCDKSGCHHKCNDTKDCVVEDEAKDVAREIFEEIEHYAILPFVDEMHAGDVFIEKEQFAELKKRYTKSEGN